MAITAIEARERLVEFMHRLIEQGKATVRQNLPVLAAMVTVDGEGAVRLYGLVDVPETADERQRLKEQLVRDDNAIAVAFFADAWQKDPVTMARVGEMLTGTVEAIDRSVVTLFATYTRRPVAFAPTERIEQGTGEPGDGHVVVAGDTFGIGRLTVDDLVAPWGPVQ